MFGTLKTVEEHNLYANFGLIDNLKEDELQDINGGWCGCNGGFSITITVGSGNGSDNGSGNGSSNGSNNYRGSSSSSPSSSSGAA